MKIYFFLLTRNFQQFYPKTKKAMHKLPIILLWYVQNDDSATITQYQCKIHQTYSGFNKHDDFLKR